MEPRSSDIEGGLSKIELTEGDFEIFAKTLQQGRTDKVSDEEVATLYKAFRRERGDNLTVNYTDRYLWRQNLDESTIEMVS